MALTRLQFPLALLLLIITVVSAGNVDQLGSNLNLDNINVDQLLGNPADGKKDHYVENKHQLGQDNYVPTNPVSHEKTKPYGGQEHDVFTKPYYGQEQKNYGQAYEEKYSEINIVAIQGFVSCESEANKYYPLEGAVREIACPSSYEKGYKNAPYILRPKTGKNGFFVQKFPPSELKDKSINLNEGKAYPKYSPSETCNVPSYSASSGAHLSLLRSHSDKVCYNVGNLIYTPKTHYDATKSYPVSNDHRVQMDS